MYSCFDISDWNSQLLIEQKSYSHIATYVFKADAALEAASNSAASAPSGGPAIGSSGAPTPNVTAGTGSKKRSPEHERVQAKLDFATALAHMGQGQYSRAAHEFLKLGAASDLEDWAGKVRLTRPSTFLSLRVSLPACRSRRYRYIRHALCPLFILPPCHPIPDPLQPAFRRVHRTRALRAGAYHGVHVLRLQDRARAFEPVFR